MRRLTGITLATAVALGLAARTAQAGEVVELRCNVERLQPLCSQDTVRGLPTIRLGDAAGSRATRITWLRFYAAGGDKLWPSQVNAMVTKRIEW